MNSGTSSQVLRTGACFSMATSKAGATGFSSRGGASGGRPSVTKVSSWVMSTFLGSTACTVRRVAQMRRPLSQTGS